MKKLLSILFLALLSSTAVMGQCEVIDMVINEARQAVNNGNTTHAINLLQRAIDSQTIRDLNCSNYSSLAEEKRRIEGQQLSSSSSTSTSSTASKSPSSQSTTPQASQNTKTVTGTIYYKKSPVAGASIKEKGTNNIAVSNQNGYFSIKVQPGATLEIRYIGCKPEDVKVGSKSELKIKLKDS
jgi:cytoskeletal protein RodZ